MKIFVILFTTLLSVQSWGVIGWDHGNAGDSYAAEFIMTARDLVLKLKTMPSTARKDINLNLLSSAIDNTTVRSEDRVFLNGEEVEAINQPNQQLIVLNRNYWRSLRADSETISRYTLVLHEYLGIMGITEENKAENRYKISGPIVAMLNIKKYNPSQWWNPLNPVNYVTLDLVYSSGNCKLDGVSFDLNNSAEMVVSETTGDCGDEYRKVVIAKSSSNAPVSSNARGTFHRYQVAVMDRDNHNLGSFTYEPEWYRCLGPQPGACASSGKLLVGDVELVFWLKP